MSKNIKTRKGNDGFHYPYTSPDLVVDKDGKSVTAKFNEIDTQYKDIAEQKSNKFELDFSFSQGLGYLTDDGDFPIDDPEEVVGPDALDSFGEWEDDTVYVRNDTLKCYYEICRDNSEYDYSDQSVDDE